MMTHLQEALRQNRQAAGLSLPSPPPSRVVSPALEEKENLSLSPKALPDWEPLPQPEPLEAPIPSPPSHWEDERDSFSFTHRQIYREALRFPFGRDV